MREKRYLYFTVFILFAFAIVFKVSCKKKPSLLTFSGEVINGATGQKIDNAFVTLASTSVQSWVYNASFQDITNTQTDASGAFSIETEKLPASAYRLYIYKQNYYEHFTVINAELFSATDIIEESYEIFEQAEVTVNIKNQYPNDADDKIIYRVVKGAYDCANSCPSSYILGLGLAYDTTFTCNTYGSLFYVVESMITKNNQTVLKKDSVFIQPFQNNNLDINY